MRLLIDQIDRTIQGLYEAALDDASWPNPINELALLAGAAQASLYDTDFSESVIYRQHLLNVSAADSELYLQRYAAIDPRLGLRKMRAPQWFSDHETFDAAFRDSHPFYVEYQYPRDAGETLFSLFDLEGSRVAILSLTRKRQQPRVGKVLRGVLDRLLPHIDRAIRIARRLTSRGEEANFLKKILDDIEEPLCCVDARGQIQHMNTAFAGKLREGRIVSESRGKLLFVTPHLHIEVMRAIGECSGLVKATGCRSGESRHSFTVSGENRAKAFVTVAPLAGAPGQPWQGKLSALVRIDEFNSSPEPARLRQALGLSTAEARLVAALCHGGSLATAAKEMQISVNTAKTQLASAFSKTGTRRQSELIALVSALPR